MPAAPFGTIFAVTQDSNTINALAAYKAEKVRIEDRIEALKTAMQNAQNTVDTLNREIRGYTSALNSDASRVGTQRAVAGSLYAQRNSSDEAYREWKRADNTLTATQGRINANNNKIAELTPQRNAAQTQRDNANSERIDLEKRLEQVTVIINMFE
jgi:chromosome segregation ATPase